MSYFEKFSLLYYKFGNNTKLITNIAKRVDFLQNVKNNPDTYLIYEIQDSDTPETIANNFYASADKDWIIFMLNDMINPLEDWPKEPNLLLEITKKKYDDINDIHHYEDENGNWVNSDYPNATAISNYTYEDNMNDEKRKIKLLLPQYVGQVETELKNLLNNDR